MNDSWLYHPCFFCFFFSFAGSYHILTSITVPKGVYDSLKFSSVFIENTSTDKEFIVFRSKEFKDMPFSIWWVGDYHFWSLFF